MIAMLLRHSFRVMNCDARVSGTYLSHHPHALFLVLPRDVVIIAAIYIME
jgi:hypothetical protein